MRLVLRPADQASGVTAVGEHALDEGEGPAGQRQHALRAVAVLDVGGVDLDGEQAAVRVGHDAPLAPVDALSGVVPFESPF